MADVAKPAAGSDAPVHKPRPEKPDEEKYKAELAKAEKEHGLVQEELVRCPDVSIVPVGRCL
jgi:hypothetical protein